MSKWEMKVRTGFIEYLWWRFMPGTTIRVKWPKDQWITLHDYGDGSKDQTLTNDPNYHYRPFLEKNVGKQGIDWNWRVRVGNGMWTLGYEDQDQESDKVIIKFRKGKDKWASVAGILWN